MVFQFGYIAKLEKKTHLLLSVGKALHCCSDLRIKDIYTPEIAFIIILPQKTKL
jgi:hypothetical protein